MLKPGLLYFAYGCNMDAAFLTGVLGIDLPPAWPARLDGWRLAFNKGGEGEHGDEVVANLVEDDLSCVYGVVFRIPHEARKKLDAFEQAPEHYRRATVWVAPLGRPARQAVLAYVAQSDFVVEDGTPASAYLQPLLRGAATHALPDAYVEWLRAVAQGAVNEGFRRDLGQE